MTREERCVQALIEYFGVDDDWFHWRDAEPEEVVRVVLQAADNQSSDDS